MLLIILPYPIQGKEKGRTLLSYRLFWFGIRIDDRFALDACVCGGEWHTEEVRTMPH